MPAPAPSSTPAPGSGPWLRRACRFLMLLGAMLMVDAGSFGWAWAYALYSVVNGLAAWLILSGRV